MLCKESGKHQTERRLPTFTSPSLCSAKKVETSGREKTTYLHLSVSMLCKYSGNNMQREDYLPSLLCPYALQIKWKHQAERRLPNSSSQSLCSAKKVETSGREKTTYLHLSVSMICKESGNIRQREDYLPSLLYLYALQRKWKHQAERKLPNFTSLSLCSAKKVETSDREKTTYLHLSVSMLCK